MLQEMADTQARDGQGLHGMSVLINQTLLREFESSFLTGEWTTLADFQAALSKTANCIKLVVPYRLGEWAAVLPTSAVRGVILSIVKVPGKQHSLPLEGNASEQAKIAQQLFSTSGKQAVALAELIRKDICYEDYRDKLEQTQNPKHTEEILRSIGTSAAHFLVDGSGFPALTGEAVPKSLPSKVIHKLLVRVAGATSPTGLVQVAVQKVLSGDSLLAASRSLLEIKCPDGEKLKLLIAAQFTDMDVEIHVGGAIPTFTGSGKYDLQVVRIVGGAEVFRQAIKRMEKDQQLDLNDQF